MFSGTLTAPLLLAQVICIGEDYVATSEIIGTVLFTAGITTLLQATVGTRYL